MCLFLHSWYSSYQILQLPSRLLHGLVLTPQDDGHSTQVRDLRLGHNQRVDIETASGQDSRHATQHSWFVLDQTVEDMTLTLFLLETDIVRGTVEDVGNGFFGRGLARIEIVTGTKRMGVAPLDLRTVRRCLVVVLICTGWRRGRSG